MSFLDVDFFSRSSLSSLVVIMDFAIAGGSSLPGVLGVRKKTVGRAPFSSEEGEWGGEIVAVPDELVEPPLAIFSL